MSNSTPQRTFLLPLIGLLFSLLVMVMVGLNDLRWTTWLVDHRWEKFAQFMANSCFEGETFGGGDPVIILLIFVLCAYILAWLPNLPFRFRAWRPQFGYILSSGLLCGVLMVHTLKLSIGRARPDRVFDGRLPFSNWYEMGPYSLLNGSFSGSFPSGHTAQSIIPLTIAICLVALPGQSKRLRLTGYFFGAVALLYAMAMGLSRAMHVSHWLSDVCASILLSGLFYYLFYFHLFKVPQQSAYFLRTGTHAPLPTAWEMRLCGLFLCALLGLITMMTGLRAIIMTRPVVVWLLLPIGLLWAAWFLRMTLRYYARVTALMPEP